MGSVWLAEHVELGTQLAIKLLDPSLASNPEWLQRFKREAQAAAGLDSPSIVRVFDYGIEEGVPYIAVHGANLKPSIASKPTSAKPAASAKSSVTAPNKPTPPAMTPNVPKPNELGAPQDLFKRREG